MALTYIGGITLGEGFPLPFAIGLAAAADAEAKLAAALNFKISLTLPTISAKLELAASIVLGLTAALELGITPPSLQLQLDLMADLVLQFKAFIALCLQLLNLGGLQAHFYAYHGDANAAGAAISAAWSGGLPGGGPGTETIDAAIIATNVIAVADALAQIIKMVP